MAGNKGGVAIRLECFDSSLCFVCSHFASGQSNVAERNADFHTIFDNLQFSLGRDIAEHDNIFFFGDFNYRVNMSNERARELANAGRIDRLLAYDQVF